MRQPASVSCSWSSATNMPRRPGWEVVRSGRFNRQVKALRPAPRAASMSGLMTSRWAVTRHLDKSRPSDMAYPCREENSGRRTGGSGIDFGAAPPALFGRPVARADHDFRARARAVRVAPDKKLGIGLQCLYQRRLARPETRRRARTATQRAKRSWHHGWQRSRTCAGPCPPDLATAAPDHARGLTGAAGDSACAPCPAKLPASSPTLRLIRGGHAPTGPGLFVSVPLECAAARLRTIAR